MAHLRHLMSHSSTQRSTENVESTVSEFRHWLVISEPKLSRSVGVVVWGEEGSLHLDEAGLRRDARGTAINAGRPIWVQLAPAGPDSRSGASPEHGATEDGPAP